MVRSSSKTRIIDCSRLKLDDDLCCAPFCDAETRTPTTRGSSAATTSSSMSSKSSTPEQRSISKFVADIAQCIIDLPPPRVRGCDESPSSQTRPRCNSGPSTQLPSIPHMAGAPSRAMPSRRNGSKAAGTRSSSLVRPQSETRLRPLGAIAMQDTIDRPVTRRRKEPSDKTIMDAFKTFALGREHMYWKDFEQLCSSGLLFDGQLMVPEARRIFHDLLVPGKRSIRPDQFETLLGDVAFQRQCTLDEVHRKVIGCIKDQSRLPSANVCR